MSGFRFRIETTLPSADGFDGAVIAGVRVGGGDVSLGDRLRVPSDDGPLELVVTGFPLIRWSDPDRRSIAVVGPPLPDDIVGGIAVQIDKGDA